MHVTLHTPATIYSPRHVPSWLLLSGAAGTVNGIAFLLCEQFVTHVTGTATRLGLEWQTIGLLADYAAVLVCFILGAGASVLAIQARAVQGKKPRWAIPLVVVALILTGAALLGHAGQFGRFGGLHVADPPPVVVLSILAFAMGLQNAAVATTTGLAVRTTHLTGPATDLGIHLGTAILTIGEERQAALRGAALRGGKALAFVVGAALSLPLTHAHGFLALLTPAACVLAAALMSFTTHWSPSDLIPGWLSEPADAKDTADAAGEPPTEIDQLKTREHSR